MFSILLVLLIIVAVFMTGIILLQKSEGSGMSGSSAASMFGGALTGAAAGNFLTKLTTWLAIIFSCCARHWRLCRPKPQVIHKANFARNLRRTNWQTNQPPHPMRPAMQRPPNR